jgi:hypothetical protein
VLDNILAVLCKQGVTAGRLLAANSPGPARHGDPGLHVGARPRVPGETAEPLARSDSLPFAPPVSGCHAVNVQLNRYRRWGRMGAKAAWACVLQRSRTVHAAVLTPANRPVRDSDAPSVHGRF